MRGKRCSAPPPPPRRADRGRGSPYSEPETAGERSTPDSGLMIEQEVLLRVIFTLAYCSSSSPARLWTSVMITPGLKNTSTPSEASASACVYVQLIPETSIRTRQSSPSPAWAPALKIEKRVSQRSWCLKQENTQLTQRYAARELIDGGFRHAVGQHTRKLSRRRQSDSAENGAADGDGGYSQTAVRSHWTR